MKDKNKKVNCTLCSDWGLIEKSNGSHILCPRCEIKRLDATIAELDLQIAECKANEALGSAFAQVDDDICLPADVLIDKCLADDNSFKVNENELGRKIEIDCKTLKIEDVVKAQQESIVKAAQDSLGGKTYEVLTADKEHFGEPIVIDGYVVTRKKEPMGVDLISDAAKKQASMEKLANTTKKRGRPKKNV